MYRCQECSTVSEPREPQHTIIIEKRNKTYSDGSTGWEIARELKVCTECYENSPLRNS